MTATPNPLIVADFSTSLAAGVSVGATTATLQSATDSDGVALAAGTYAFAVDTNSSSKKEYFIASLSGTALTAIQSVSRQGALTSGFARAHRIGATVVLTDHASLRIVSDLLRGSGTLNPSAPLAYDSHPTFTSDAQLIDKKYADDLSVAGAANASTTVKGIVEIATSAEINAGTGTGATGAVIAVSPDNLASSNYATYLPSAGQKEALVGTSGTPGTSNKYVTDADTATSGNGKVLRLDSSGKVPSLDGSALTNLTYTYKSGIATRDTSATSTQTIAHSLGKTPAYVRLSLLPTLASPFTYSDGVYTSSGNACVYHWHNGSQTSSTSTSFSIAISNGTSDGFYCSGVVSVDATNITITWTRTQKGIGGAGTVSFLWTAQ